MSNLQASGGPVTTPHIRRSRYGNNGRFRMSFDTLDALLHDGGEACVVVLS